MRPPGERLGRARTLVTLFGIVLMSMASLGQLDRTMGQMHEPGGVSGGMSVFVSPMAPAVQIDRVRESWRAWATFQAERDRVTALYIERPNVDGAAVSIVGAWWLLIDALVRIPALALLLVGLLRRRALQLATSDDGEGRVDAAGALDARLGALQAILGVCVRWVVWVFVALEMLGALLAALLLHHVGPHVLASTAGIVALLGRLTLVTLLLPLVAFALIGAGRAGRWTILRQVIELRIPLLGAAFLYGGFAMLPSNVRDQLNDILRDWAVSDVLMNTAAVATLGVVLAWACRALRWTGVSFGRSGQIFRLRTVVEAGVLGVSLCVVGFAVPSWKPALLPSGLVVAVWALLSFPSPIRALAQSAQPVPTDPHPLAVRTIATIPLLGFAIASLEAHIGIGQFDWARLVGMSAPVLAVGAFWRWFPDLQRAPLHRPTRVMLAALLMVFPLVWAGGKHVDGAFRATGVIGLFVLASGFAVVGFSSLDSVLPRAGGAFAMLRIRRIPLVTCAAILLLVSSSLETSPGFHRVRALNASAATTPLVPTSLVAHLDAWVAAQPIAAHDDVRPMVLVATSGGGIRAAYWQVLVSNCMFLGANPPNVTVRARPTPVCDPHVHDVAPHPVAIASGISGGSVGVAIALARAPRPVDADEMFRDGWMDPVTGNLLFVDMPNAFLNLPYGRDRARALEDEWIRRAPTMAAGLFATQLARDPDRRFPLVLLSSSSVQDGCRLNVSVLDATPTTPADSCRSVPDSLASTKNGTNQLLGATRDVVDYLSPECGRGDLRLATAALLSARFPIVSPPGGLDVPDTLGASGSCEPPADRAPTYLIDGGFVDASGARPIVDLLPEIRKYLRNRNAARGANEPCIQPVVIQIDNSYADLTRRSAVNRPGGLRSPLTGFLSASGGATDSARQDLANVARDNLEVGCSVAGQESGAVAKASRYIHIHPEAHPGIEAPLGWTLSHASRVDLEQELFTPANVAAIACVRAWLLGGDLAADCSAKAEKLSGVVIPTR